MRFVKTLSALREMDEGREVWKPRRLRNLTSRNDHRAGGSGTLYGLQTSFAEALYLGR